MVRELKVPGFEQGNDQEGQSRLPSHQKGKRVQFYFLNLSSNWGGLGTRPYQPK